MKMPCTRPVECWKTDLFVYKMLNSVTGLCGVLFEGGMDPVGLYRAVRDLAVLNWESAEQWNIAGIRSGFWWETPS